MSTGLYSGVSGLALGTGLYRNIPGLSPGGGLSPPNSGLQPYLVLNFVGASAAALDQTLSLNFTLPPTGTYTTFVTDPSQPQSGFAYYQVWE
jgi:hypothetical protein